jgi:glyoxylase-like metal-dependent hydrolase (beta-lactamase superfamily II)
MPQLRVTPLEVARLRFDLADAYGLPPGHPDAAAVALPVLAYHLALPGRSVVVDAPVYDEATTPEAYRLPAFRPPPPLPAQLHALGIELDAVTDVVVTHAHFDHLGALARPDNQHRTPTFPRARHYLGRPEWDPAAFAAMARYDLQVVDAAGLLTLVDGDRDLGDGLSLIAAPGESAGHMLVRVQVGNEVAYVVGDLYHHAIEFAEASPSVRWVDSEVMRASQRALTTSAAMEDARLYFSHIEGAHVVRRVGGALRPVPLPEARG